MSGSVFDSGLFKNSFGTAEMRGLFDDAALVGRYLEIEAALALEIRRQYLLSSNELAEVSISLHPADRFKYSTRITRQSPA